MRACGGCGKWLLEPDKHECKAMTNVPTPDEFPDCCGHDECLPCNVHLDAYRACWQRMVAAEKENERLKARRHKKNCYLEQCEVCAEDSRLYKQNADLRAKIRELTGLLREVATEFTPQHIDAMASDHTLGTRIAAVLKEER